MIPISTYQSSPEVENLVLEVLRSGQLAQGPMVERFEELVCGFSGAKHAVAVSNGTVSLIAALMAHNIGPGDEVITSPFTFVATLNAILFTGATAVFADIDEKTYCIDPQSIKNAVTEKTKAIMPVHLYGQSANMQEIGKIAAENNCAIIEDAAQAHGATFNSQPVGSFGTGSFSFYTTKNVGSGEGGVVTTNDDSIAHELRLLRNQGMAARYQYERVGWNFRLTDIQAAIAIPQLEKLDESNKKRNSTADLYNSAFADNPNITTPYVDPRAMSVWHQYTIRVADVSRRDDMINQLHEMGIGAGVYYPRPVFEYDPYMNNDKVRISDVDTTRQVCESVISIPVHHYLSESDVQRVIEGVNNVSR
jgi:perosamine synthetase